MLITNLDGMRFLGALAGLSLINQPTIHDIILSMSQVLWFLYLWISPVAICK